MKNILTVSKYTFLEVYRSKVMMSIFFLAITLVVVTYIASEFTYGAPAKIALDFGLGIISLSNLGMAIFIGATLISKEVEQRTLYMILSKPISRVSFLLGKILGLSTVLIINTTILTILTLSIYNFYGGKVQGLMIWASYFSFIEAFIVLLFAILFSLLANTAMSVIYSIMVFVSGHAIGETSKILFTKANIFYSGMIKIAYIIFPNFYKINLKDFVIYHQELPFDYIFKIQAYSLFYIFFLLLVIINIFKQKNLD